jgi:hypothetical protein
MPGSIFMEIILWCIFLLPGFIYSVWRHAASYQGCSECGSKHVIPPDSPIAVRRIGEIAGSSGIDITLAH